MAEPLQLTASQSVSNSTLIEQLNFVMYSTWKHVKINKGYNASVTYTV